MHTFRSHRARTQTLRAAVGATLGVALGLFVLNTTPRAANAATPAHAVKPAKAAKHATHTVSIDGTSFQPQTLTIKAGDTVVWVNKDPFPHTATSQAPGFDSHAIAPGTSWKYVAAKKGEFAYVCTFHPTMKATLHVE